MNEIRSETPSKQVHRVLFINCQRDVQVAACNNTIRHVVHPSSHSVSGTLNPTVRLAQAFETTIFENAAFH